MAANFNVSKMYSTVEIMDGCKYYRKIIIVILKERIAGSIFFYYYYFGKKHTVELITQTINDCKLFCQNKCSTLQRMDDCHSFCDKIRYNTSRDGCNPSGEMNRLPFKIECLIR